MNAFQQCGVQFLQTVTTPLGKGIVQGIMRFEDGALKVMVSHEPKDLPPEIVPFPVKWKLCYYDPEDIVESGKKRPATQSGQLLLLP